MRLLYKYLHWCYNVIICTYYRSNEIEWTGIECRSNDDIIVTYYDSSLNRYCKCQVYIGIGIPHGAWE